MVEQQSKITAHVIVTCPICGEPMEYSHRGYNNELVYYCDVHGKIEMNFGV